MINVNSMKGLYLSKLWLMILMVSMTIGAISCGGDTSATSQFPDTEIIKCSAGDHKDLVFTADNNWRLSSDAEWCKFQTSSGNLQDISGRAGTHTITLVISNDQIKDSVTYANITIIMGGKKSVIARVERDPDKFNLKVFVKVKKDDVKDDCYVPINDVIEVGYGKYTCIVIWANFDFVAVEYPEWVEVVGDAIVGTANKETEAFMRIVPNGSRERYPITKEEGYEIVFSDVNGNPDKTFTYSIAYSGMGEDEIAINGPTAEEFGWEITPDGKHFTQITADDTTVTFENELLYKIIANNDIFDMIYIENVIERGIPSFVVYTDDDDCWMHFDKERMALTVDPTETLRYGYVLALPHGKYEENVNVLKDGFFFEVDNSSVIELPVLKNDYLQYIVASFTQRGTVEADPETQMHIYHSLTAYDIPATRYTDSTIMEQYDVEEAYIAPFVNSIPNKQPYIVINPRVEGWTTDNLKTGAVGVEVWYEGRLLRTDEDVKEYYVGENVDELLALHLYGLKDGFKIGGENIYVVFKVGGEAKKLLVVTPPTK